MLWFVDVSNWTVELLLTVMMIPLTRVEVDEHVMQVPS